MKERWFDLAMFCGFGAMILLMGVVIVGGVALEVSCWRSQSPESMACFMMHGQTARVRLENKP